ncbi:phospholipase A2-like [Neodiprion pinetum]|uniref:phospholipase A2-like n=1 Tax=Neodiprion pinetum TaxID=441929 RepID=UPI001EDEB008|nr:phospholipase A2-like [Neodiprion pinetum]
MAGTSQFLILLCAAFRLSGSWVIRTDVLDIEAVDTNDLRETRRERLNLIFPGTKWCGSGNVADNYDDLGTFAESDACCRTHDHCEDIIEAMDTKFNLTNPSFYTRVHCSCDEKFYDCLHGSPDEIGDKVGILYFSFLGTKCFRNDYPIVGCKRYHPYPKRCLEYELDESQPMMYQWFDIPLY